MCGRYVLNSKIEIIEGRFHVNASQLFEWKPNFNIAPGTYAPVITSDRPDELQLFRFGLTPFWSKKKSMMFINARSEGDLNQDDDPFYNGEKGIVAKPAFRQPIRSQRCLIPADAFIEGPTRERLSKPYLVYLQDPVRPFALAGIFDYWKNPETGEVIRSFAIVTTVANALLQMIPHHRGPVILRPEEEKAWLDEQTPIADVAEMLKPYPAEKMNAYPISPAIKNPKAEGRELIDPVGERLVPEGG
jgi:putative SOS response-associated peptidase YedK